MIPPSQKDKLSKNRKSQASDFKMTWELWMPYSPECCSCGIPIQDIQKKSISVDMLCIMLVQASYGAPCHSHRCRVPAKYNLGCEGLGG